MTRVVTKINDTTINVTTGIKEKVITVSDLLTQKALLLAKIANFDARVASDRLELVSRLNDVNAILQAAEDAGVIVPE